MREFLQRRAEPVRAVLRRAVAAGELDPGLDLDAAVSRIIGPLVFRRVVTGEPLDAPFLTAVLDGFLAAHADRECRTPGADRPGGTQLRPGRPLAVRPRCER